jgi:outer membrane protein assembly factor BamB
VFVTGTSDGKTSGADYATIAYNAATGARLWIQRYNGPGNSSDTASSVAVSPAGGTVFVTGTSDGKTLHADYATIAYNAATGARLWVQRYRGPDTGGNIYANSAAAVTVSPDGGTVFVTGNNTNAYATVAYNPATGAQLWAQRYRPGNSNDRATSIAVSPDGGTVYVTGTRSLTDYETVAYNAATGARLWVQGYNGGGGVDVATSVAVSPDGGTVYVTGASSGQTSGGTDDYATVAYDAATGAQLWAQRYNGPDFFSNDGATSVAVSPAGGTVYVTGRSTGTTSGADYATIAYNAATGSQLWVQRYNGPGNGDDGGTSVAVSPHGGTVYVTGSSTGTTSGADYATIAYSG